MRWLIAAVIGVLPAISLSAPAADPTQSAYQQGHADRITWEKWFNGLNGDARDGALYWANQRSLPHPGTCDHDDKSSDWQSACHQAIILLAPADIRRKTEPQYWFGWNSPIEAALPSEASADQIQGCKRTEDDLVRLQCFDSLFGGLRTHYAVPTPPKDPAASVSATTQSAKSGNEQSDEQSYVPSRTASGDDATTKPSSQSGAQTDGKSCKSNWQYCKDNADLANNYTGWNDVAVYCKIAVNNRVKYGDPVWPSFWSGRITFSHFLGGSDYVPNGVAVAIEPDVQVQNGFGAMVHSTATCRFDLRTNTVLDVEISPN